MKYAKYLVFLICVAAAAACISVRYWATDQSFYFEGPSFIQVGADNSTASVLVQDRLFIFDSLDYVAEIVDLGELGKNINGSFDYFSNGDILFYHHTGEASVLDNLAKFLRLREVDDNPPTGGEGFYRCSFATQTCDAFTYDLPALGDHPYGLEIDRQTDEVYVAATARFELYKLSPEGTLLAKKTSGLLFPNVIKYIDGNLYVTDTNNHEIKIVDASTEFFGDVQESHEATIAGTEHQWPSAVEPSENAWWVIVNGSGMGWGRVIRFDADWGDQTGIPLPLDAWPVGLTHFQDALWVTDLDRMEIHRFSESGEKLANASDPRWESFMADQRAEQRNFQNIATYALVGMIISLVLGLAGVYILDKDNSKSFLEGRLGKTSKTPLYPELELADGEIRWFKPRRPRRIKVAVVVMQGMIFINLLVYGVIFFEGSYEISFFRFYVAIGFSALFYFLAEHIKSISQTEMGLSNEALHLRHASGRQTTKRFQDVIYSGDTIIVGDMALFAGQKNNPIYPPEALYGFLYPALASGKNIGFLKIQSKLFQLGYALPSFHLCLALLLPPLLLS